MLALLTIFTGSFVVGLSGAMAPGPVLTLTISEALKRGFKAGPLIVLGHAILEIILLILIIAGLGTFLKQPAVTRIFSLLGGIVLLWMGGHMVVTNRKATEEAMKAKGNFDTPVLHNPITEGIVLSISNPYWIIWWATIGLGFMTRSLQYGLIGLLCFYLGHIMADLIWYSFVSFSVTAGRRFCAPVIYRFVFIFCGVSLGGLGIYFLSSAF